MNTGKVLELLGHSVVEASPAVDPDAVVEAAMLSVVATGAAVLGARRPDPALLEAVSRRVLAETESFTALDVMAALGAQHRVTRPIGLFFGRYDLLLTPTIDRCVLSVLHRRRAAIAAAAAVVLVAAGGGALAEEQRVRDAERHAAQAAEIEAVLTAPDAVVLTKAGPGGKGHVTLVTSQERNEAVAAFGGLQSPGVDRTYQLWTLRGERATDKGKLGIGVSSGSVLVPGIRDAQAFAITNEPAGGSPAPTPPQLVRLDLT